MKKRTTTILAMLMILSMILSACASGGSNSPPSGGNTSEGGSELKAGAVLGVGGLGDQSFNDLVYAGLERAQSELGVDFDYAEPKQASDFELFLREMAVDGEYAVIIAIGFEQQDALTTVAAEFPDQKFGFIDGVVEAPNIVSYTTAEEQASFLVGAMAGLVKADAAAYGLGDAQEIGFVGALNIPLINKFRAGYEAGARYVNPEISVRGDYVGSFDDITTAKEIANTMNANGADIIYHAAGGAGLGVFQSTAENNGLSIGCNSNQNYIDPDHIMASMLKRVDVITFDIVQSAFTEGAFQGGATVEVGLADEGVGYTCEQSNISVSQEILDQVESLKDEIVKGTLIIPSETDAVDAFLAENQYHS